MKALRSGAAFGAAFGTLLAAAVLAGPAAAPGGAAAVAPDGAGPLRLGAPLSEAAARARTLDPAALAGPGCDGREMVSLTLPFTPAPLQAMAMADPVGRIEEIRLQARGTPRGETEAGCRARLEDFADTLLPRVGEAETRGRPGVREIRLPLRGALAEARWFPAGGSCDLAVTFGGPGSGGTAKAASPSP